jgi:hypothetical protein
MITAMPGNVTMHKPIFKQDEHVQPLCRWLSSIFISQALNHFRDGNPKIHWWQEKVMGYKPKGAVLVEGESKNGNLPKGFYRDISDA